MNQSKPTSLGVRLSDKTYDRPGLFSTEVPLAVRDEKTPAATFKPDTHERANMALDEFIARMRRVSAAAIRVTQVEPRAEAPNDKVSDEWLLNNNDAIDYFVDRIGAR